MKKAVKITLIGVVIFALTILLSVGIFFLIIEPDITLFRSDVLNMDKITSQTGTVTILDVNGDPIEDAVYRNNKIPVKYNDLNSYTVNAFIAIEDKRFFKHHGVDYKRMVSALFSNIKSGGFHEGASTITQQLIKNTHLSNEKTIGRKINEIRLARKLERVYGKKQILESYFNILYFGSGIRGLGTASRVMFDKPASQLTLAQSAVLASIINNPSRYSPYYNPDNLTKRKELVLKQMLDQGFITVSDYNTAIAENITFNKNKQSQFISGVLKAACRRLKCSEKALFIRNCTIKTSYDPKISDAAREAIKNIDEFTARILILDNATGRIICDETNSSGYIDPQRSPASAVKPFLSYAYALENGMTPLSFLIDERTTFGDYDPRNYNNIYRGYQSLTDCLIYSSNIAAVKLLLQNGIDNSKHTAEAFGLDFEKTDNSLPIALGGMEKGVTLIKLANAYRTLANGGIYSPVDYLSFVTDNHLTVKTNDVQTRAVGDDTAYLLTDMLKQCVERGTAKKLKYSGIIAAKTGTNGDKNGNYDCYCIAYTPSNTVAVWFGADDKPIPNNITGASCCEIIKRLYDNGVLSSNTEFEIPQSVAYFEIDGKEMHDTHEIYLADPLLPKRYRHRVLLSKRNLPVRKNIDIIDYYDKWLWENDTGSDNSDLP